jgi:hypothetical protein
VAVLRLPLSAVVLGVLLTDRSGAGSAPLVIFGVVVAYLVVTWLSRPQAPVPAPAGTPPTAASARPSGATSDRLRGGGDAEP